MRLGIFEPTSSEEVRERRERVAEGEQLEVLLMGRTIPVVCTQAGWGAAGVLDLGQIMALAKA